MAYTTITLMKHPRKSSMKRVKEGTQDNSQQNKKDYFSLLQLARIFIKEYYRVS